MANTPRYILVILGAVTGCASQPSESTLTTAALLGAWTGSQSNGKTFQYTFTTDNQFTYAAVHSGTSTMLGQGSFSTDGGILTLDGSFLDEEGTPFRLRSELDAYASASAMCDSPLRSEGHTGVVGTWTAVVTSQQLDATGAPIGQPVTTEDILDLYADGTMAKTNDGLAQTGTYTQDGDHVTTMIGSGNVVAVRTFTLVDDQVLCDPVYVR